MDKLLKKMHEQSVETESTMFLLLNDENNAQTISMYGQKRDLLAMIVVCMVNDKDVELLMIDAVNVFLELKEDGTN